jgi:hypothetical protein
MRTAPKYLNCSTLSKGFITYLYVVILSCILISRHNHMLRTTDHILYGCQLLQENVNTPRQAPDICRLTEITLKQKHHRPQTIIAFNISLIITIISIKVCSNSSHLSSNWSVLLNASRPTMKV